ncbi:MAG: carbohydrate kinase family protein [Candidatus Omnitrophica bacterium]|nr:carbohydrate kinase family protein [Candidatus Omnitrophota bacterium]
MDVICLGILVADVFVDPIDALPSGGELKLTNRFLLSAGGCAANTAACLRRLQRSVRVLGKVGTDMFGDFVITDLKRLGIDTADVKRSETHPTSATVILNVRGEDRRYVHCFGANADFSGADVDGSALEGARALYVGGYLAMPRFSPEDLVELFRAAKERSLSTILDVVVPAGTALSLNQMKPILELTDVFLPNDDEARILTGQKSPIAQAERLTQLNPACTVVITQGRRGALARRGNEILQIATFKMNSVDESGAGDAFDAGFITGLLENWPLEQCLRFASAVGASCTRALGCTEGVFHFDEAMAFVAGNPIHIEKLNG